MKRGVPLFILRLSATLLAGRLAAFPLSILRLGGAPSEGGISPGAQAGVGKPPRASVSAFAGAYALPFEQVALSRVDNLCEVEELFLTQEQTGVSNVEVYLAMGTDFCVNGHLWRRDDGSVLVFHR